MKGYKPLASPLSALRTKRKWQGRNPIRPPSRRAQRGVAIAMQFLALTPFKLNPMFATGGVGWPRVSSGRAWEAMPPGHDHLYSVVYLPQHSTKPTGLLASRIGARKTHHSHNMRIYVQDDPNVRCGVHSVDSCAERLGAVRAVAQKTTAQMRHRGETELRVTISNNHVEIGAGSRNRTHDQRFTKRFRTYVEYF
jgi:hypothetical protein